MQQGTAQAVESHDDKRVPGVQAVEKRGQDRTGGVADRGGFLGHRRAASCPERAKLRFQRLFARGGEQMLSRARDRQCSPTWREHRNVWGS